MRKLHLSHLKRQRSRRRKDVRQNLKLRIALKTQTRLKQYQLKNQQIQNRLRKMQAIKLNKSKTVSLIKDERDNQKALNQRLLDCLIKSKNQRILRLLTKLRVLTVLRLLKQWNQNLKKSKLEASTCCWKDYLNL